MGWFRRTEEPDGSDPETRRAAMVRRQIRARGVSDPIILEAVGRVPRHLFVPPELRRDAYVDAALPIGRGQTISQPYVVAYMTEALEPLPGLRVLEVGTGSGYQAAVLAACGMEVWSIERIGELQEEACRSLREAELAGHVRLRTGDGARGWPEEAPFDRILVTAAAPAVPRRLLEQLAAPGILVAPIGPPVAQVIRRVRRDAEGRLAEESLEAVRFVPLVSDAPPGRPPAGA